MADKVLFQGPAYNILLAAAWVANDKGFFREEGIEVEVQYHLGQELRFQPSAKGRVAFRIPGGSPPFRAAREGGEEINVVSLWCKPAHILVARPGIKSVADLKGRNVIAAAQGSSSVDARVAVRHLGGLDPDRDINWVFSEEKPPDTERARLEAMRKGEVDAVCSDPPHWQIAVNMGWHILPSARDVFDCYPEGGLSCSRQVIEENPDLVRRVVRAAIRGAEFARLNREETLDVILRHNTFVDRSTARICYDLIRNDWNVCTHRAHYQRKIETYVKEWGVPPKPFGSFFDLRFVQEAMEELKLLRSWQE